MIGCGDEALLMTAFKVIKDCRLFQRFNPAERRSLKRGLRSSQFSETCNANGSNSILLVGMVAAGAATIGATLLPGTSTASGKEEEDHAPITKGDIAILTFLSALEQVEADLWIQYAELGGATNQGLSTIDLELNGKKIATGLAPN